VDGFFTPTMQENHGTNMNKSKNNSAVLENKPHQTSVGSGGLGV
jgi:hypothetical protein